MRDSRRGRLRGRSAIAGLVGGLVGAALGLIVMGWLVSASGTPFPGDPRPPRWPENKTITFWVPPSAHGGVDRSPFVREGIRRWQPVMTPRGITINVPDANPGQDAPNLVVVRFRPAGSRLPMDEDDPDAPVLGAGVGHNSGLAGALWSRGTILSGEMILLDTLPAATAQNREFLRNLAAHEVCHVLGLADDALGSVTRHEQANDAPRPFNERDMLEIDTLYPVPGQQNPARAEGEAEQQQKADTFEYRFEYIGHADGHVPLIVMDVDASVVSGVLCPPGWVCLNPADPFSKSLDHPFYHEYMTTGSTNLAPWKPCSRVYLAFRAVDEGVDLTPENPTVIVGFIAQDYEIGFIEVWAGDEVQLLPGPVPIGQACIGDLNGDGVVDVLDLLQLLDAWGECQGCIADLNSDGVVDVLDLLHLLDSWGPCPEPMEPTGACCFDDGSCVEVTEAECAAGGPAGGNFAGPLCACGEYDCTPVGGPQSCVGRCGGSTPGGCWCDEPCHEAGDCCDDACEACADLPSCDDSSVGACCIGEDTCAAMTADDCAAAGGEFHGIDSTCEPTTCDQPLHCGHPDAGECCKATGSPFCSGLECCTLVCGFDPYCCEVQWDEICAMWSLEHCEVCRPPAAPAMAPAMGRSGS